MLLTLKLRDALLVGVTLCQQGAQGISGMLALLKKASLDVFGVVTCIVKSAG